MNIIKLIIHIRNIIMSKQEETMLGDDVISEIAKVVQIAIITGTDVVDNLRLIRIQKNSAMNTMNLTSEYRESSEANIQKLMEEMESSLNSQKTETVELFQD